MSLPKNGPFSPSVSQFSPGHSFKRTMIHDRESPTKRITLHAPHDQILLNAPSEANPTYLMAHSEARLSEAEADEFDDDIEDGWKEHIIMAVDVTNKGIIGCCYYVAREQKLLLMSEICGGGLEILDSCWPADNLLSSITLTYFSESICTANCYHNLPSDK